jgi:uncharacterized protein affecting Mg2+/Co2+ transport
MLKKTMLLCVASLFFLSACEEKTAETPTVNVKTTDAKVNNTNSANAKPIAAADIQLGYRLERGKTYKLATEMLTIISVGEQEIEMAISGNINYMVFEVANNSYKIQAQFKDFLIDMSKINPMVGKIDSKNMADDNVLKPFLEAVINTPFGIKMQSNGEIIMVDSKVLFNKIIGTNKVEFSENFSPEGLKESLNSTFFIYPATPLEKGQTSWKQKIVTKTYSIDANYSITSANTETFTVAVAGKMIINSPEIPNGSNSSYTANLILDTKTGWIRKGETKILMDIEENGVQNKVSVVTKISSE